MALATRVIPTLLCRGRQLIKGKQYDAWRSVGVVAQAVRIHQMRGVDELVLLDIAATPENRGPDLSLVAELANNCFMPLSVGGGIKSIDDIRDLLNCGADKVVIGSASKDSDFIQQASEKFGSQCIVISVDVKGCRMVTGEDVDGFVTRMVSLGAGELLVNSMDREGMMQGYDLELIKSVSRSVDVPVIASCGCGNYAHMLEAVRSGAFAVAAGAMFQFTDLTPRGASEYLSQNGVEARCA